MNVFLGIMIPFIGTTAGAACVFFMRKNIGQNSYIIIDRGIGWISNT